MILELNSDLTLLYKDRTILFDITRVYNEDLTRYSNNYSYNAPKGNVSQLRQIVIPGVYYNKDAIVKANLW